MICKVVVIILGGSLPHQANFYKAAVELLMTRHENTSKVLILSDDMEWCRRNLRSKYETSALHTLEWHAFIISQ